MKPLVSMCVGGTFHIDVCRQDASYLIVQIQLQSDAKIRLFKGLLHSLLDQL